MVYESLTSDGLSDETYTPVEKAQVLEYAAADLPSSELPKAARVATLLAEQEHCMMRLSDMPIDMGYNAPDCQ